MHTRTSQLLFLLLAWWQIALVGAVPGLHLPIHVPSTAGEQAASLQQPTTAATENGALLPDDVKPVHYNVTVQPHESNWTFDGEVEVELRVLKTTRQIVLHVDELNVTSQAVICQDDM
jgi:hypothetical protein